jgi:hypothetical protein
LSAVIFLITIAPIICSFIGFLAGAPGEKLLRSKLTDFYFAVQGDWTELYRAPSRLLAEYLTSIFGAKWHTFVFWVATYSVITTCLLSMAHLNLAIPNGVDSAGAILTGEGYFNLDAFMRMYVGPNLVGDFISWPISFWLFSKIAKVGPFSAFGLAILIVLISIYSFIIVSRLQVWQFYFDSFPDLSFPTEIFSKDQGFTLEYVRLSNALHEIGIPSDGFTFDYWGAVPLAVFLPGLIFGVFALLTLAAVALKPVVMRPLTFILERIDASSKKVFELLAAFMLGVAALTTAIVKLMG